MSCFCVNTPELLILSEVENHGSIHINGAFGFDQIAKYGNSVKSIVNSVLPVALFFRLILFDVIPFIINASLSNVCESIGIIFLLIIGFLAYSVPINPSTKYRKCILGSSSANSK